MEEEKPPKIGQKLKHTEQFEIRFTYGIISKQKTTMAEKISV